MRHLAAGLRTGIAYLSSGVVRLIGFGMLGLIRFYQAVVSPHVPAACRYTPTCSRYAAEAIQVHGAWHGGRMALRRLLSCRPGGGGGDDPVAPRATAARADTRPPSRSEEDGSGAS